MPPTPDLPETLPGISDRILTIREHRVLLDADLARFYGVTAKRLREQVRRNPDRFPGDFLLTLTADEKRELAAKCGRFRGLKHSNVLPFAFTEHGALMAASVLNSPRAVQMSVLIVRAFVALRHAAANIGLLAARLREIDRQLAGHDDQIRLLAQALEELLDPVEPPEPRRVGFRTGDGS